MAEKIISIKIQTDAQTQQLAKFTREVDKLTKERRELNKAEKAGKVSAQQASKARSQLNLRLKANRNALRDVEAQILKNNKALRKNSGFVAGVSKGMKQFATSMFGITAAVLGVIRAIGGAINSVREFEQANANLAAVLGDATVEELTALEAISLQLGATTKFTSTEVAQLQTEYAKLGLTTGEIINATDATLQLAAATGTDLAEAASVVGNTLGGFGLDAEETQRVVDVMAKSFSSSALDMEKFKESMKLVAPVAKAVGVSIEETTAMLGTMASAGISGSNAGTALRKTFIELGNAGLTLEQAIEKVNGSQDRLGAASDLVGKKAASAFLILADGADKTKELNTALGDAAGTAQEMADKQLDTLEGSITKLSSAYDGFIKSVLEGDGILKDAIDTLTSLVSKATFFTTSLSDRKKNAEAILFVKELDRVNKKLEKSIEGVTDKEERAKELRIAQAGIQAGLNAKIAFYGREINRTKKELSDISSVSKAFNAGSLRKARTLEALISVYEGEQEALKKVAVETKDLTLEDIKAKKAKEDKNKPTEESVGLLEKLRVELKEAKDAREALTEADEEAFIQANESIKSIQGQITELENLTRMVREAEIQLMEIRPVELIKTPDEKELAEDTGKAVEASKAVIKEAKDEQDEIDRINREARIATALETAQTISDGVFQIMQNQTQREVSEFNRRAKAEQAALAERSNAELNQVGLTDEKKAQLAQKFATMQENLEKRQAFQRDLLERKAFEKQKRLQIAQAIANGALAITNILANTPDPTGTVQALRIAASIATTGIQIGVIASQQFAKGGVVEGGNGVITHGGNIATQPNGDNVLATVRTGEVILNEQQQAMLGGAPTFRSIGVPGFANGGLVPSFAGQSTRQTVATNQSMSAEMLNDFVDAKINSLDVRVSEQAITGTQRNVSVNESLGDF